VSYEATNVERPILSVSRLLDGGNAVFFRPRGAGICRASALEVWPDDHLEITRRGGLFVLEGFTGVTKPRAATLAPVTEDGGAASSEAAEGSSVAAFVGPLSAVGATGAEPIETPPGLFSKGFMKELEKAKLEAERENANADQMIDDETPDPERPR
jgi:hypothetical protein